jgi:hypothetical protein
VREIGEELTDVAGMKEDECRQMTADVAEL